MRLNSTAGALLGLLRRGPVTPYRLAALANETIGNFWTVTQSQVYRELAAMDETGLVVRGERGPRDRRLYAITDAGRVAFAAWVEEDPEPEHLRIPLLLKLTFLDDLDPGRVRAVVRRHRDLHADRLAGYQARERELTQRGVPEARWLTLKFGLAYERAALAWFADLPAELRPQ
jgi:DNA-binding PadR family transcriptional regulator